MLRILRLPLLAVLGFTVSACATMNVSSHVEQGLDFSHFQTWQWAPPDALPASDARMDNSFFQDHFQGAVERELAVRGLTQTVSEGDVPDLLVHYHANIAPRIDVNHGDQTTGACYDENCNVRVFENEVGTIIIDVVDGHTNRLIWRGWAQNPVEGVLDHPQKFQDRIQTAVKRMFERFPRSI
jgi:uncharacterized protein DUF4136